MTIDLDPDTDLGFSRVLAAPRHLVWECWTRPEHVPHFFVPAPHRVTGVDIDLRVGGRFNTTFDVDGAVVENRGVYLEIVPEEKLVFTDSYTEGWKPTPAPFMTAILLLADAPGDETAYTVIVRHRTPEIRKTHEEMGFLYGWGTAAAQLEAYCGGLQG